MSENVVKKEYDKFMFFHGVTFDKKSDQECYLDNLDEFGSVDSAKYISKKYSRYCVCGKFDYVDNVLELGLSMLEFPHPYVKKKAREVALNNLLNENEFSFGLSFEFLEAWFLYKTGNELKVFNEINYILKRLRRGSLITFFKEVRVKRLIEELNKINN